MSEQLSFGAAPSAAPASTWARLSDCGTYRYELGRRWAPGPSLWWVMLNPSTADAEVDDPTIRRVVRFSSDAGFGAAVALNLFALRATDPRTLDGHPDPVGPDNDDALRAAAAEALRDGGRVVCAWGAKRVPGRVSAVLAGPLRDGDLWCLGTTKAGHPRHPLYVPGAQPLVPFRGRS